MCGSKAPIGWQMVSFRPELPTHLLKQDTSSPMDHKEKTFAYFVPTVTEWFTIPIWDSAMEVWRL